MREKRVLKRSFPSRISAPLLPGRDGARRGRGGPQEVWRGRRRGRGIGGQLGLQAEVGLDNIGFFIKKLNFPFFFQVHLLEERGPELGNGWPTHDNKLEKRIFRFKDKRTL